MKMKRTTRFAALFLSMVLLLSGLGPAVLGTEASDFRDVPENAYYAPAVDWAVREGVTNGTAADAFSPEEACTRGQVVTFLWRAAGSPEQGEENPFTDVKPGAYYEQAVLWAVREGITNGTSDDAFSPEEPCTRAHIVTFLWRYEGRPGDTGSAVWYADAMTWAEESGLLSGTGEDFAAEETCPRRDVVYYLWGASVGTPELLSRGGRTMRNIRYVMIYNPMIYSDEYGRVTGPLVSTGSLAGQVDTETFRGAELEEEEELVPIPMPQEEDLLLESDEVDRSGARSGDPDPSYSQGDRHTFYTYDYKTENRIRREFTCVYAGSHCCFWSYEGSVSADDAETLGKEFDSVIYPMDAALFGQPRFTENGGKINVLCYPVKSRYLGFFTSLDNYATGEVSANTAEKHGMNLDHAIITVNAEYVDDLEEMKSTLAHELQHQIAHSDVMRQDKSPGMKTWIDEAMSTYAEDQVYPYSGEDKRRFSAYFRSGLTRRAQSLYNFNSTETDAGCYGGVRLFARYFASYTNNPFWYFHEYWRSQNRASLSTAEALFNSCYSGYRESLDAAYRYPRNVSQLFRVKYDEWMSKMTLDFYIKSLDPALCGFSAAEMQKAHEQMLYTSGEALYLEGGGRIIIPVYGEYTMPEDAGSVLVYIGLDESFRPVDAIGINETGAPQTQPVQQHSYSFILHDELTWYQAWQKAREMGGYLCTLDSEEEFLFLNNYIESQGWFNIAFRLGACREKDGRDYYWVNKDYHFYGDSLNGQDHWMRRYWFYSEPTFTYGDTDEFFVTLLFPTDFERGGFNDLGDLPYSNMGYIVEYDN